MKTLSDLKRNASKYEWKLVKNSWYDGIPEHQLAWRPVGRVQSNRFTLWTDKDGSKCESWVDFPKASELHIEPLCNNKDKSVCYEVTFKRDTGAVNKHEMIYFLRTIEG